MAKVIATIEDFRIKNVYKGGVVIEIVAHRLLDNGKTKTTKEKLNLLIGDSFEITNGEKKYQKQLVRELLKKL